MHSSVLLSYSGTAILNISVRIRPKPRNTIDQRSYVTMQTSESLSERMQRPVIHKGLVP